MLLRGIVGSAKAADACAIPFNGGATTLDALWMTVPVVTLAGEYFTARMGATILNNVGLPELVVVIDELGRAVAPGPFVPTVIASAIIAKDGDA